MTPERWQRLQEVFERALPLDTDERARVLVEECGNDIALREQVLSLLLASSDEDGDLEQRYDEAIAATLREPDLSPGTPIGRYRVQRLLGRGGMGAVYLAERADEQYQHTVAIKVVARRMLHVAASRFRSERQILARLNHSNIARLFDGGHTDDGTPYFVMEYVEGSRIDEYCQEHRLSTASRLALLQQVCAAVEYAHQNLVVHRDLKPSNILVTREGTPKLLDFGIAKLLDPGSTDAALTRVRDRVLTPEHASPEQLRGDPVGTVTDVYNLGALLYELLTGLRPYGNEQRPLSELEQLICEQDPLPPSEHVHAAAARGGYPIKSTLSRELAGDLDNIVLKAMHRDPARRYPSAAALAQDIANFLAGRPVLARPDTFSYRAGKFLRRNAWQTAGVAAAVLTIAGLTAFYTLRVAAERDRAELEATKAKQVAAFLGGIFRSTNPWGTQGKEVTAIELLDRGAQDIEQQLANQPVILAELLFEIGNSYKRLADYDRAGRTFERSLALKEAAGLSETAEYARVLYEQANVHRLQGRFEEGERLFEQTLQLQRRIFTGPNTEIAATLTHFGQLYSDASRWEQALPLQREALSMTEAVLGPRHAATADRMNNLALALQGTGRLPEAEQMLRQTVALHKEIYPPTHPDALVTRQNHALLLNAMGRYREAEAQVREVLAARRAVLGNDHPSVGFTQTTLGNVLIALGKYDEAGQVLNDTLRLLTDKLGDTHFRVGIVWRLLGRLAFERGDYAAAEEPLRRAERIDALAYGETSDDVHVIRTRIAAVLLRQGRVAQAEPLLEQAYAKLHGGSGGPSGQSNYVLEELGGLRLAQGRLDEAVSFYERALERHRRLGVGERPETADSLLGLAEIALRRGQRADAAAFANRALANVRRELPENHRRVRLARAMLDRVQLDR